MAPRIVFHLNRDGLSNWRTASRFELYKRIADLAEECGDEIEIHPTKQTTGTIVNLPGDNDLHFVHGGSVRGVGWLNSSLSYLEGFWHVDTDGILANSSARNYHFDTLQVRRRAADAFAQQLRAEFVERRRSRYNQKIPGDYLPEGCIAVFLQGRYPYAKRQNFMSMVDMINDVLQGSGSRPVVVKPHPLEADLGLSAIEKVVNNRSNLWITHANVHDIIERAVAVVSVNSSVTFEAFMHNKPSIVFGRTDHPSLVETVRKQGEFATKLADALERKWDYPGMLHWYFGNHSIRVKSRKFLARLQQSVVKSGRDPQNYRIFQVSR